MNEIGFATSASYGALNQDDRLLLEPLAARGVRARPVVWTEALSQPLPPAILIRSCWDYHLQPKKFLAWIRDLQAAGVRVWNPPPVLQWNHDKLYLQSLHEKGVRLPETIWMPRHSAGNLHSILREKGWEKAVVKPLISATAHRTWISRPDTAAQEQAAFEETLTATGAMVQRFVPEVQTGGEWSLLFFDGRFSHAVLKRPKDGDYRVQEDYGGSSVPATAPTEFVRAAEQILQMIEEPLLYARVDGVAVDGQFSLMELELIEPLLFLSLDPAAPDRFADAIIRWLNQ